MNKAKKECEAEHSETKWLVRGRRSLLRQLEGKTCGETRAEETGEMSVN